MKFSITDEIAVRGWLAEKGLDAPIDELVSSEYSDVEPQKRRALGY